MWLLLAGALLALPSVVLGGANDRVWTGGSTDYDWQDSNNWQNKVGLSAGDDLIFDGVTDAGNSTNYNNEPDGFFVHTISVNTASGQDFVIGGNRIVLTSGISETAAGIGIKALGANLYFNITPLNEVTFTASHALNINGNVDFYEGEILLSNSGTVTFNGTLFSSTPHGEVSLIKTNSGTLSISSTCTVPPTNELYAEIDQGTVRMLGVASNSQFNLDSNATSIVLDGVAGYIEFFAPGTTSLSGTGTATGIIYNEGTTNACIPGDNGNPGVLSCNVLLHYQSTRSGSLQIKINGTIPGADYSQLLVYSNYDLSSPFPPVGGLIASLNLDARWNYTPQIGDSFLVLTQAYGQPYSVRANGFFNGLPPSSIYDATNGASLSIVYDLNGVTLSTIRISSSPFVLWKGSALNPSNYATRNWSVTNNWAQNSAPASGSAVVLGPNQMTCYATNFDFIPIPPLTNDLALGTTLSTLSFTGTNYTLYGNSITLTGGITNNTGPGTNLCYLDIATPGTVPVDVEPGGSLLLGGGFAGSGIINKKGAGTLIYSGTTMNAYLGTVVVDNGTLEVDGSFTDGSFTVNGGVLDGTGTVSAVTLNGGTLKPGDSPGILHMEGDLAMAPGSTFEAELNGPVPGTGYDQLQVAGGVNLNGASLNLRPNYAVTVGTAFLILVNDGSDPIVGTFAGLPEGATFQSGGQYFSISYKAGSGHNDVVATRVNPAATFSRIQYFPPAAVQLQGSGAANSSYSIFANTNLAGTNWINLGTIPTDNSGAFLFNDSNVLSFPQRFYEVR